MRPTLVIVDMQHEFEAALDPNVVVGVTYEIIQAKEYGSPIVIVEYDGFGRSHDAFFSILKNYRRKAVIKKNDDDGSNEVIRALKRRRFNPFHLRVCGVNSDACVLATVEGLLDKLSQSKIEVVKRACGTDHRGFTWREFVRHPNLQLV